MSNTKREVAKLQLAGLTPDAIAERLSITEGYISQLQNDMDFSKLLEGMTNISAVVQHSIHSKIDTNYNVIEESLTGLVAENIDVLGEAMLRKPTLMANLLRTVNQAKRRSTGETNHGETKGLGTVVLEMPAFITHAAPVRVQHNQNNEVVQIGERPLVAMNAENLAIAAEKNSLLQESIKKLKADAVSDELPMQLDLS